MVRDCGGGGSSEAYKFDSFWWLFAKCDEGCNPVLGEDLQSDQNLVMEAGVVVYLYAEGTA